MRNGIWRESVNATCKNRIDTFTIEITSHRHKTIFLSLMHSQQQKYQRNKILEFVSSADDKSVHIKRICPKVHRTHTHAHK